MRAFALALFGALAAAGCLSPAGVVDPAAYSPSSDATPSTVDAAADEPAFCSSASNCDFWDEDYHEYVLYDVDTYIVDVLIVPSASPFALQDTATMKHAVDAWAAGIEELGVSWFTENFTINAYVVGQDTVPQAALEDPEIIVVAAEYNPFVLFGIGLQLPELPCRGGDAEKTYAPHQHDGTTIYAADCEQGGLTCVALNTNFLLGGEIWLHDLVAHEFGHCLGVGHVGDALDFSAKRVPIQDIMSYQHDEEQVHCVSNLNVRVLEAIYAPLLGQTVSQPVSAGDYYTMPKADYAHVDCDNP